MESAKLLQAIIENSNEGIITIDRFGIVESINPAGLKLFNYTAEEVIGNNISMLMPEPYKSQHDHYIEKYLATGQKKIIGIGREVLGQKKDRSVFPFWLSISEVNYGDRKIFTGFVQDLSKQKEAEEKLRVYTEELEKIVQDRTEDLHRMVERLENARDNVSKSLQKEKDLNQLKSQFVSMASHEFRTPLGSMQLSASLINKYADKQDILGIHKHTLKIKNSVELLTNILNDFLSLDRLEGGDIKPHFKEFNLIKFSEEIIEEMQLMAKQDQKIVYHHSGDDGEVNLDPHLLKNAVTNLISNAIKYSGENTIIEFNTFTSTHQCKIEVRDNGIGIPEADQKHLLEPFFRANNTGKIPGTGLGLNIVKQYAHLMNGEINWSSKLDEGTTISLTFNQ